MQLSNTPIKIQLPWAAGASAPYIITVPVASQQGVTPGRGSWTDGFPPLNAVLRASGGVPPFMSDMNGALNQISAGMRWLQAVGLMTYDATFQTAIGGYPSSAIVQSATVLGRLWQSIVDNNVTNPDASGAGWVALFQLPLGNSLNLFVNASTGNDSNTGASGSPFLTLQKAENYTAGLNLNGQNVIINCTGAFTAGVLGNVAKLGGTGPGSVTWNFQTGATVTCAATSCFFYDNGATCTINGPVTLVSNGTGVNGCGLVAGNNARIAFGTGTINFGHCSQAHMASFSNGQILDQGLNYTVSGGALFHWSTFSAGQISVTGAVITLSGSPGFTAFASGVTQGGMAVFGNTFSGSIGGGTTRFNAEGLGYINTGTGAPNGYLPGTINGTTSNGGICE